MSWRFRKSFKVLPGVRLNVSKTGVSASIGGAPFTLNMGPRGVHRTVSFPGTGLSFRERIDAPPRPVTLTPSPLNPPLLPTPADLGEEIRSAGTDVLTSEGLSEFKD